jgi:hypothetical protein
MHTSENDYCFGIDPMPILLAQALERGMLFKVPQKIRALRYLAAEREALAEQSSTRRSPFNFQRL